MSEFHRWHVADFSELAANASVSGRVVKDLAGTEVLVFRIGRRVFAMDNECSHLAARMLNGTVFPGSMEIECPWHKGRFDLESGAPTLIPCRKVQPMFKVEIEGNDVFVLMPVKSEPSTPVTVGASL